MPAGKEVITSPLYSQPTNITPFLKAGYNNNSSDSMHVYLGLRRDITPPSTSYSMGYQIGIHLSYKVTE